MLKKIVVPLDGSPLAEVALPYAEEIAGKTSTKIILLSVLATEEAHDHTNHHIYGTKVVEATKRHIEKYLDAPKSKTVDVAMATRVGSPAEGILDYINKGHLSLTIMATHGRSGLGRWAVGSVADKVVRATTRQPLMLIRAKGAHPDIRAKRILKKALIPLDGSPISEAVIPYISQVAKSLRMELTLLRVVSKNSHVSAEAEAYLERWCVQFEEEGVPAKYEVRIGSAADEIIDLADELASDMVAMSTQGQSAITLWPLGSVAQKVLLGGNTPLLLVRA